MSNANDFSKNDPFQARWNRIGHNAHSTVIDGIRFDAQKIGGSWVVNGSDGFVSRDGTFSRIKWLAATHVQSLRNAAPEFKGIDAEGLATYQLDFTL